MILDFPFNESCLKTYLLILINFWIIKILVLKNIIFWFYDEKGKHETSIIIKCALTGCLDILKQSVKC